MLISCSLNSFAVCVGAAQRWKAFLSILFIHFSCSSPRPCSFLGFTLIYSLTRAHTPLHSCMKSHPALSTGAAGLRLNMCHRARHGDDRASITAAYRAWPRPLFSWPAALPGALAHHPCLVLTTTHLRENMNHLCPPCQAYSLNESAF